MVMIERRYNGPPDTGNGGWSAGNVRGAGGPAGRDRGHAAPATAAGHAVFGGTGWGQRSRLHAGRSARGRRRADRGRRDARRRRWTS